MGLLAVIFIGAIIFLYKKRMWIFYWVGAKPAPLVYNNEGGRLVPLPFADFFRETHENGKTYWESRTFRDKFPADHLRTHIRYIRRKRFGLIPYETLEILPLIRSAPNSWARVDVRMDGNATPLIEDIRTLKYAQASMAEIMKNYFSDNLLEKYVPLVSALILAVVFLVGLYLMINATSAHITAMNANTDAMLKLANATLNATGKI